MIHQINTDISRSISSWDSLFYTAYNDKIVLISFTVPKLKSKNRNKKIIHKHETSATIYRILLGKKFIYATNTGTNTILWLVKLALLLYCAVRQCWWLVKCSYFNTPVCTQFHVKCLASDMYRQCAATGSCLMSYD